MSPSFVTLYLLVSEIPKCIAQGCLLLFYKNYIVYYNVYCYYCDVLIEKYVHTTFRLDLVSYMRSYVPIVMYCLSLFFTNYIVYQIVYMFCMIRVIGCYHVTKFRYSTPYGFRDS